MTDMAPHVQDDDHILDRVYQIAIDPSYLDEFIEYWAAADQRSDLGGTAPFEQIDDRHLTRAQLLLQQGGDTRPDLASYLYPYEGLAALIVNGAAQIAAANHAAQISFRAQPQDYLNDLHLPSDMRQALIEATQEVMFRQNAGEKLLKVDVSDKQGVMLFRITRIEDLTAQGPLALIVSTHFHMRDALADLLRDVFQLTQAEQDIVQHLTQGQTLKQIAQARGVSDGTLRGQVKSIFAKMNVKSQADIVRLAMTLNRFPKSAEATTLAKDRSPAKITANWLDAEVWKPLAEINLPDGRRLTYHDMGPRAGHPILLSHMGSCMVRWPRSMLTLAYEKKLRIICPVRAGYGHSTAHTPASDPFQATRADALALLDHLGIDRLPFAVQGSDLPLGLDLAAHHRDRISALIFIGGQLKLPGGRAIHGAGRWQRFFVSMAERAPNMVHFASRAVMAMCRRIGPEAMLRQLCKDAPADLALIQSPEMREVMVANIGLMAGKSTNAATAFAREYIAFQQDWTGQMMALQDLPMHMLMADQDPTIDLTALPQFRRAYPWIEFQVMADAGLGLIYQKPKEIITLMAEKAAMAARP